MTKGQLLMGFLVFSFLPIWRGAGHPRTDGQNIWRLFSDSFNTKHLTYEEAVLRAREAYQAKLAKDGTIALGSGIYGSRI